MARTKANAPEDARNAPGSASKRRGLAEDGWEAAHARVFGCYSNQAGRDAANSSRTTYARQSVVL